MTAVVDEPVRVGERLIVMSWHTATEGRKLHTEAVLYSEDGTVKGRARHIEIKVPAAWAEQASARSTLHPDGADQQKLGLG